MPLLKQRPKLSSRELQDHPDTRHVCQARVDIIILGLLGTLSVPPLDSAGLEWTLLRFLFGGAGLDRPPDEEEVASGLELGYLLDMGHLENQVKEIRTSFLRTLRRISKARSRL